MKSRVAVFASALVLLLGTAVVIAGPVSATGLTWTGGGADANWSTPANWSPAQAPVAGDALSFPAGAARTTNVDNLTADTSFSSIAIGGDGYAISGNQVATPTLLHTSSSAINDTLSLPVHFTGASPQLNQTAGASSQLTLTGAVSLDNTVTVGNDEEVDVLGVISGAGGVHEAGAGLLNLAANNTYTGPTSVSSGELAVNGQPASSAVTVTGGQLRGIGAVGTVAVSGTTDAPGVVSPGDAGPGGNPVGTLRAGNTSLADNGLLSIELAGASANLFSQLQVTGSVSLGANSGLAVDTMFTPSPGTKFTIVDNDGSDPVVGTFSGLAEGSVFSVNASFFQITYKGGDGNDVVLTTLTPPPPSIVTAPGPGGGPHIRSFGGRSLSFMAGDPSIGSGASVTVGDFSGAITDDILVGSGVGVAPSVKLYNADGSGGNNLPLNFPSAFHGGLNVAILQEGTYVAAAGPGGGPEVKVTDADGTVEADFYAYDPNFHGGVSVAVGDVNGDGVPDIITGALAGGGPEVRIFGEDGTPEGAFYAYDPNFHGGVNVAVADINGDGVDEIVTGAGPGGGPHVRAFAADGTPVAGFFAYSPNFHGGVYVGAVPDFPAGHDDIVTGAGPGGGPDVEGFRPDGSHISGFFAYDPRFGGGVRVAGGVMNAPAT